jgi:alanine dehydrogenase
MDIGLPKEVKVQEYRVGLTPFNVGELVNEGHTVFVETQAGSGIGFSDSHYAANGAQIVENSLEVFQRSKLIVKVKEPQPEEFDLLNDRHILFTYLHLAPDPKQASALLKSGCAAIAYETVTCSQGTLPLLIPMSQVAGRLSIQAGAFALQKQNGGSGVLLGGVPGVDFGKVVVIGGGVVGSNAIRMAIGRGAHVTVLEKSLTVLEDLDKLFGSRLNTLYSSKANLEKEISSADLVVGAVLVPGAAAPRLLDKCLLKTMQPGSVLVDVAIDQGGCFETSRPTTHENPLYAIDGILHYCVTNMPGAVPRTSTLALNNATLPFVLEIANLGLVKALKNNSHLRNGLNVFKGEVTHAQVASHLDLSFKDPLELLV